MLPSAQPAQHACDPLCAEHHLQQPMQCIHVCLECALTAYAECADQVLRICVLTLSIQPLPVLLQNLLGNDCAKARVNLCVKGDPLCLPTQEVVSESNRAGAPEAAQQVATALDEQCTVSEPTQPGVKVRTLVANTRLVALIHLDHSCVTC